MAHGKHPLNRKLSAKDRKRLVEIQEHNREQVPPSPLPAPGTYPVETLTITNVSSGTISTNLGQIVLDSTNLRAGDTIRINGMDIVPDWVSREAMYDLVSKRLQSGTLLIHHGDDRDESITLTAGAQDRVVDLRPLFRPCRDAGHEVRWSRLESGLTYSHTHGGKLAVYRVNELSPDIERDLAAWVDSLHDRLPAGGDISWKSRRESYEQIYDAKMGATTQAVTLWGGVNTRYRGDTISFPVVDSLTAPHPDLSVPVPGIEIMTSPVGDMQIRMTPQPVEPGKVVMTADSGEYKVGDLFDVLGRIYRVTAVHQGRWLSVRPEN